MLVSRKHCVSKSKTVKQVTPALVALRSKKDNGLSLRFFKDCIGDQDWSFSKVRQASFSWLMGHASHSELEGRLASCYLVFCRSIHVAPLGTVFRVRHGHKRVQCETCKMDNGKQSRRWGVDTINIVFVCIKLTIQCKPTNPIATWSISKTGHHFEDSFRQSGLY